MPEPLTWQRRAEPEELPEWMDEPCSYEDFRACLHDLGQVNWVCLGYRPTLAFLDRLVQQRTPRSPLRILDVGSGGGDMLRRIARWAKRHNIAVELTGVDLNPYAARAAKEANDGHAPIRWLTGDAFSCNESADVVISSLLTHHLATSDVVRFLAWMEQTATTGWFINDLERSARAATWFASLAKIARWHRFVQHDGPVSFQRSFRAEDWAHMLQLAGIPAGICSIEPWRPGRLCVSRLK